MHFLPIDDGTNEASNGVFGVFFGATSVGKTASSIQSLPKPILILENEMRNIHIQARAVDVPQKAEDGSLNYVAVAYDTFPELIEFIGDIKKKVTKKACGLDYADFKSILIDGVTQLTNNLKSEIADTAAEKRDTKSRNFISDVKVAQEGFGAVADHMLRVTVMLKKLSRDDGKVVIFTTLIDSGVSWDGKAEAYPAFVGKKYGVELPGMCDFIGMVERRFEDILDEDGEKTGRSRVIFPPWVKFEEVPGENFLCKWSGKRPVDKNGNPVERIEGPLMLDRIINNVLTK